MDDKPRATLRATVPAGRHGRGRAGLRRTCVGALFLAALLSLPILSSAAAAAPRAQPRVLGGGPTLTAPLNASPLAAPASTPAPSFQDTTVISGLTNPTVIRFASDGRIFVAEKSGLIKVFGSLTDTTPTVVADLRPQVDDYWDRGLLGFTLDPNFPTNPYVYALYAYDAPIGGTAPKWNDACPTPPGATTDGCVISGRLVRIQVSGDVMTGSPQTLINDWCQQYPSHSIGTLNFGPDGALYVSGGDGASFTFADYGQGGGSSGSPTPKNPCGDPPAGVGGTQTPPTAEGGALRSQSLRRAGGEPVTLNGSVLRVDPATGAGLPDNPNAGSANANARRIIAMGLRNPFRFTFRPGTSELWIGDVGWNTWEEIDRRVTPTGPVQNFGWPCYEGASPMAAYQSANLNLCNSLYSAGTATAPYYTYVHGSPIVSGENCLLSGSSITGIAFYNGSSYPASYNGGLFFADHSRNCIWAMPLGSNGQPDPSKLQTLIDGAANPVDVEAGPNGDLFYVDLEGGTIHRIQYGSPPPPPPPPPVGTSYLSDLSWTSMVNGLGPVEKDRSNGEAAAGDGVPMTIGGVGFAKGLGAHAASDLRYNLGGTCSRFKANVGVDGEAGGQGSVDFQVYADATKVYDSGVLRGGGAAQSVDVSVAGASGLRLVVTNGGDNNDWDHADWANASVDCGTATQPTPVIDSPASTLTWAVGDPISFSGHATDPKDGTLPASALSWAFILHHCPTTPDACHPHPVQTFNGVATGSLNAPDHGYPSWLELQLKATNLSNVSSTASVRLDPKTASLSFASAPSGLTLTVGSDSAVTPFPRTVIAKSVNSISAPPSQTLNGTPYSFSSWSDGGAATHNITAPAAGATTFTANYAGPPAPGGGGTGGGANQSSGLTTTGNTGGSNTTAPGVSDYGITNNPFAVGGSTPIFGSAAKAKKHKKGTTFHYMLSEAATVKIIISQRRSGRRKAKKCVAPTHKLRKAKKCVRIFVEGTLTRTSHQGKNSVAFSGRIGSKALEPGGYQAILTATDNAKNTSRRQTINFSIVKR